MKVITVGSDFTYEAALLFIMSNDGEVRVTEKNGYLRSSDATVVDKIRQAYALISRKTYPQRLRRYIDQLESSNCFEYSGWKFYPTEGKIVFGAQGYSVKRVRLLRHHGFLEVQIDDQSVMSKIKKGIGDLWTKKMFGINTTIDTDVFFSLLKERFGIEWKE